MRRLLLLALLFSAVTVEASWLPEFSQKRVVLHAGESATLTVRKRWTGLVDYGFEGWQFGSDNSRVARVSGGVPKEGGPGEVRIEAVKPGTARIYLVGGGGPFVTITVTEALPALEVHVGGPLTIHVGRSATYTAISSDTNATFQWYRGEVGDTRDPYATGPEMQFTPELRGESKFWVKVTTPRGLATAAFTVTAIAPDERRRSVRH